MANTGASPSPSSRSTGADEAARRRGERGDPQRRRRSRAARRERLEPLEAVEQLATLAGEGTTAVGEQHAASAAFQEHRVEIALELLDLLRHRGRRVAESIGRGHDRAVAVDGDERTKSLKIDHEAIVRGQGKDSELVLHPFGCESGTVTPRHLALGLLVAVIWGVNFVVIDLGLRDTLPLVLVALRFALVAVPLVFLVPRPDAPWRVIAGIGLFMSAGQFGLLFTAMHLGLPAGLAAVVLQCQMIFTLAIGAVALRERPTRMQLVGAAVALAGLGVVAIGRFEAAPGLAAILPMLICVAAGLSWGIGNVISRSAAGANGFGIVVWSALVVPVPVLALSLLLDGPAAVGDAFATIGWPTHRERRVHRGARLAGRLHDLEHAARPLSRRARRALRPAHAADRARCGSAPARPGAEHARARRQRGPRRRGRRRAAPPAERVDRRTAAASVQAPPSARLYAQGMTRRRTSEPIYSTAIVAGRGLFGFWGLKPRVRGAEHLPATGGAVLAMTHFGYLDFALVEWVTWLANRRRIRFMAKQGAFDTPVVGWLLRGMRHIAVDMTAGAAAYAKAVDALRQGELLGVFPEAGVSASFTVRALKTGAVRLAAEAGVPVIPVAVWGGQRLLTKRHRVGFFERFGVPVSFAFGRAVRRAAATRTPTSRPSGCARRCRASSTASSASTRSTAPAPGGSPGASAARPRRPRRRRPRMPRGIALAPNRHESRRATALRLRHPTAGGSPTARFGG